MTSQVSPCGGAVAYSPRSADARCACPCVQVRVRVSSCVHISTVGVQLSIHNGEEDSHADERRRHGRRLEQAVRDRWRDPRGIRGLAAELGFSRATLYAWFRGDTSPDTQSLGRLAKLLYMTPSELIGELEGADQASLTDERIRAVAFEALREESPMTNMHARMLARAPESWRRAPDEMVTPAMAVPSFARRRSAIPLSRRRPRRVLDVIGPQEVAWCSADDPVGPVARRLYEASYSQLPVRERDTWIGLVTTDTIARWTAARSGRRLGYDESVPVREVLAYAEDPGALAVVGPDASADEVLRLFEAFAAEGRNLAAVLVTASGTAEGEVQGIVTRFDARPLRG